LTTASKNKNRVPLVVPTASFEPALISKAADDDDDPFSFNSIVGSRKLTQSPTTAFSKPKSLSPTHQQPSMDSDSAPPMSFDLSFDPIVESSPAAPWSSSVANAAFESETNEEGRVEDVRADGEEIDLAFVPMDAPSGNAGPQPDQTDRLNRHLLVAAAGAQIRFLSICISNHWFVFSSKKHNLDRPRKRF